MKIITISGHAGSGKDTCADIMFGLLAPKGGVLITHYADLVKHICKKFFGWDGQKDEYGRRLLQYIGTDVVRKNNPDFWVDFLITILKLFPNTWDYVLIPDARFPNEVSRFIEEGFDTINVKVVRDCFESELTDGQKEHSSETSMDDFIPDYYIDNNGSLDELAENIKVLVEDLC